MTKYTAGGFDLIVNGDKVELHYKGKVIMDNCDDIIKLNLDLGLNDTSALDKYDVDEEEIEWLEKMLFDKIFSKNICLSGK